MNLTDLLVNLKMNAAQFVAGADQALGKWQSLQTSFIQGGAALSVGLTGPILALGNATMGMATQMAGAEIGFTTMLGSGEKAKEFLDELKDFAAKTPFEFIDLVRGARRLMALGFAAEEVVPMMRALGNAAAGLGGSAELIDRLGLALGQMRAKGKVSAEEMRQLAEAGIPAWEFLAKAIGTSVPEAMDRAQKGAIQATTAIPAIIEGMNAKFGGMMENFSKTAMGQWSNLKDTLNFTLADIGKSLLPLASMIIEKIAIPAANALKVLAEGFSNLPDPIKYILIALTALAAAIGPVLLALAGLSFSITAIGGLLGATGLAASLAAILPILAGVAAAVAVAAAAFGLWQLEPVRNAITSLWETLKGFWTNTLEPIAAAVLTFGGNFAKAASSIIGSGLKEIWDTLTAAATALWAGLQSIWEALSPIGGAFLSFAQSLSPVWEGIQKLFVVIGELVLALGMGGLGQAIEITKTLFGGFWFLIKNVADFTGSVLRVVFMMLGDVLRDVGTVVAYLAQIAFRMFAEQAKAVGWVFSNIINPALDMAISGLRTLLDWIMKIPGVKSAIDAAGVAFDTLKEKVTSAMTEGSKSATEFGKTQYNALNQFRTELEAAKKSYDGILAKFQAGKATTQELTAAHEALAVAQKNFSTETKKMGLASDQVKKALAEARAEFAKASANVEQISAYFKEGKATSAQYASAQEGLRNATTKLNAAMDLAKKAAKSLGVDVADLTRVNTEAAKTSKELQKEATAEDKAYKAAAKTYEAYTEAKGRAAIATLGHLTRLRESKEQQQALDDYLTTGAIPKTGKLATVIVDLDRAYNKMTGGMDALAGTTLPYLNSALQKVIDLAKGAGLDAANALTKAFEETGSKTTASLDDLVRKAEKNYETILNSVIATSVQEARAWLAVLEARKEASQETEGAWTEANEKQLDATRKMLDNMRGVTQTSTTGLVGMWKQFGQQVSTIITDLGKGVADKLFDLFRGGKNKELDKEAEALQSSLAERAGSWEEFQRDIAKKQNEARADYARTLSEEESDLQDSLRDREDEYNGFVADILKSIETLKANNAEDLAKEIDELQAGLSEKKAAYEEYASEVARTIAELRENTAEKLAEDIAELNSALEEKKRTYEDYVEDVNTKLGRIGESLAEDIEDQTRSNKRGIEDRTKEYERYERDINQKIADELAKGSKANLSQVKDWRDSLADRKDDLDTYLRRANEDLDDFVEDHKKSAQQQTDDLNVELDRRAEDFQEFTDETASKLEQVTSKSQEELEKQIADLTEGLAKRQETLAQDVLDTQAKIAEVTEQYKKDFDVQLADLQASLANKTAEWEKYNLDVASKFEEVRAAAAEKLAEQETDLTASLANGLAEYEKFKNDVASKLGELESQHVTVWSAVKDLLVGEGGVFDQIGKAFIRIIIENGIKEAIKALTGPGGLLEHLGVVGKALDKILGGTPSTSTSSVPTGGSPSVGGAAGTAASGVMDTLTAVGSIGTLISSVIGNFQMAGMNKSLDLIEHEVRYTQIHALNILEKLNTYLPAVKDQMDFLWNQQYVLLSSINDFSAQAVYALTHPIESARALTVRIEGGSARDQEFAEMIIGQLAAQMGSI